MAGGVELDDVAGREVCEAAEEAVAVAGDSDVAGVARESCAGDVACGAVEGEVVGAFKDRDFNVGFGDANDGFRRGEGYIEGAAVGADAGGVPESVRRALRAEEGDGEMRHRRAVEVGDKTDCEQESAEEEKHRS